MSKVEDFFITPLEAHFESQPTEGQRDTILADMDQFSPEILTDAVEWLKRARQAAKTFPSPKECNKALSAVTAVALTRKSSQEVSRSFGSGMSYGQKLREWVAAKGPARIIHKGTHEWREWCIYFLATDNVVQYPIMRTRESWTVPTLIPAEFDSAYVWEKGSRLLREAEVEEAFFNDLHRPRHDLSRLRGFSVGDPDAENGDMGGRR